MCFIDNEFPKKNLSIRNNIPPRFILNNVNINNSLFFKNTAIDIVFIPEKYVLRHAYFYKYYTNNIAFVRVVNNK